MSLWAGRAPRRVTRRRVLGLAARGGLGAVGLVLVGCSDQDDQGPASGRAASGGPATETGGAAAARDAVQVLRVYVDGEPSTLDPQRATDGVSASILRSLYSGLVRIDEHEQIVANLAAEAPTVENGGISADGLTYTFRLRGGLGWSDGTPLTAEAFVAGARRLFEPGSGNVYADFYRILAAGGFNEQVEAFVRTMDPGSEADKARLAELERQVVEHLEVSAPDDRTVVYRLNRRSPVFLLLATLWPLAPVRQDLIEAQGTAWTEAGTHVSNGPFLLSGWSHNTSLTLSRNPHYHGAAPALERIEIDMIPDVSVALLAYQNGEIDVVKDLGAAQLVQVRASDALRGEFRSYAQLVTQGVFFNFAVPALRDARVRQALTGALDREQYAEVVREGAVLPAYSWVPPGMPGHDAEAGQQYRNAVPQSQRLLAEAGVDAGSMEIELLEVDTETTRQRSEWIQAQWESALGIRVRLRLLEPASYVAARTSGDYEATVGGWSADYPDPQNWLPLFRTGGLLNSGGFSDAEFDRLVDAADVELDNARRVALYVEAQRRMLDLAPFAPLYHGRRNILVKPWVQELVPSSMEAHIPGDLFLERTFIAGRA